MLPFGDPSQTSTQVAVGCCPLWCRKASEGALGCDIYSSYHHYNQNTPDQTWGVFISECLTASTAGSRG